MKRKLKHINHKILAKYVKAKHRLYPQPTEWFKAYSILLEGYYRKKDLIEGAIKESEYLRKPTWIPKARAHGSIKQYVLQSHILYAYLLDDQEILDAFGHYLLKLEDGQWVRSIYKPDGTKIRKKKKKKLSEMAEEILANPKSMLRARKILSNQRLLKKHKYK